MICVLEFGLFFFHKLRHHSMKRNILEFIKLYEDNFCQNLSKRLQDTRLLNKHQALYMELIIVFP